MRTCVLVLLVVALAAPVGAADLDSEAFFARLKTLEGSWQGVPEGTGEAAAEADAVGSVHHDFRVSANGTVLMETMNPDTPHEMINMYHVDGEDLILTHYCAGGNQPVMRLDRSKSSTDELYFDFAGGTNLDPEVDPHIHSASMQMSEDGRLVSSWASQNYGEAAGTMTFHLERAD